MVPNVRTALAALLLAVVPAVSHAQRGPLDARWLLISSNTARDMATYVDTTTIVRHAPRVAAWVSFQRATPAPGTDFVRLVSRGTFDCKARTSHQGAWVAYAADGHSTESGDFTNETQPRDVAPGTAGENVLEFLCDPRTP